MRMRNLLVLGSKPDPVLPAICDIDQVACANASGFSAKKHGLPDPVYTVLSAVVVAGKDEANRLALSAMQGLRTETLFVYRPPRFKKKLLKRLYFTSVDTLLGKQIVQRRLSKAGFSAREIVFPDATFYTDVIKRLCGVDPSIEAAFSTKTASTGVVAILLGLANQTFDNVIVSGFSFQITHAYANNPLIQKRGTTASKHSDTDITLLQRLGAATGRLYTTEPVVNERCGIPIWGKA